MKADELESCLRAIVAELCLVPVSRVTADADLFKDLGLGSLKIVVLFHEIRRRLNLQVPFMVIDHEDYATFAKLLRVVRKGRRPI